jgi:hypothetical protein
LWNCAVEPFVFYTPKRHIGTIYRREKEDRALVIELSDLDYPSSFAQLNEYCSVLSALARLMTNLSGKITTRIVHILLAVMKAATRCNANHPLLNRKD